MGIITSSQSLTLYAFLGGKFHFKPLSFLLNVKLHLLFSLHYKESLLSGSSSVVSAYRLHRLEVWQDSAIIRWANMITLSIVNTAVLMSKWLKGTDGKSCKKQGLGKEQNAGVQRDWEDRHTCDGCHCLSSEASLIVQTNLHFNVQT